MTYQRVRAVGLAVHLVARNSPLMAEFPHSWFVNLVVSLAVTLYGGAISLPAFVGLSQRR